MTISEDIKAFVKHTLGCQCPEQVFEHIEWHRNVRVDHILLSNKLNVGNRLLIYVLTGENTDSVKSSLLTLVRQGKNERDTLGFNRLRLVIVADETNVSEIGRAATGLFERSDKDERVHLHVVKASELPPVLIGSVES